jgi:DNA polymerase-1
MIYYVGKQKKLFEFEDIKEATIEECYNYLKELPFISIDTETTGFDPYLDKLLLIQLGDYKRQYVIDASLSIIVFKDLLESKVLYGQNLKFDLRFLFILGIFPTKVYDTYLAEVKLTQGMLDVKRDLGSINNRYVGDGDVDKSLRGLIHRGITDVVIKYAANDIKNLELIREKQLEKAIELDLVKAINLENNFVIALAYTEFCGIYVDKNKWIEKIKISEVKLQESLATLNNYIINNNITEFLEAQLDLFSSQRTVRLNWNSEQQVKKLFKQLGINVKTIEEGELKESVESKVLKPQEDRFPIITLYLEYKKWEKDLSTYGYNFLKKINPVTGRIHTSFTQVRDTGRMSSGGKNKSTKEEYVNLQNIPSDSITRNCFTNQYDNTTLINSDYSGMESVVLANISQEENLIKFYNEDLGDLHSFVASKLFVELANLSLDEIKKKHKDKRQTAKAANFALSFGGTGFTISKNLSISREEGDYVEKAFFDAFKGLKAYFDNKERETLEKGYVLIDEITGSKYFIGEFNEFLELHKKYSFDNKDFWSKYKEEKKLQSGWFFEEKAELSKYFRWKGQLRRYSLNYPVQGSSSSITKMAGILFYRWIRDNNLLNKVLISNIIHDEFLVECPIDIAETTANKLKESMEDATKFHCTIVPLRATPVITKHWTH